MSLSKLPSGPSMSPTGQSLLCRVFELSAFVALLLLAVPSAQAQSLDAALADYRDGRLEQALAGLTRVRESASADPATLASAHVYLGVIHATMGDESLARRDFEVALALDPELAAPSELSPELRRIFDQVQQSAVRLSITLQLPDTLVVGEELAIEAAMANAPAHLVAAMRARAAPADGAVWVSRNEGASGTFRLPGSAWSGGATLELTVEALTVHGGVLARTQQTLRAGLPAVGASSGEPLSDSSAHTSADPALTSGDEGGSVVEEAWFWILIGTVVLGGAAAAILIPTVGTQDAYELGVPTIIRM